MSSSIELAVVEGQPLLKDAVRTVTGSIQAKDLVDRFVVPHREYLDQKGYQRPPTPSRINKLARDLRERTVDLPTAILLNIREFDESWMSGMPPGQSLRLPASARFYVVDGQHRVAALQKLIDEEEESQEWGRYRLHFVCMLGATELQEMRQFYVVNSTAKNVRTDLALDLLKQQAENDTDLMSSLIDRGESWKVNAQSLAEKLGYESVIWKGRVRFPSEPSGGTTITSSSMVSSLKALMSHSYFGQLPTEDQLRVLDAYWKAIRAIIPQAFDDPSEYTIQKGLGAMVMHSIFPNVLEVVRSRHGSLVDPESYEEVLEEAPDSLQEQTPEGVIVEGADFWRKAPEGAAGQFSSSAGRRVLTARLRNHLPSPDLL